jgi:hypothetical protein
MSESFAHEGGIDPDGWASASGGSLDEALAAEIEDHLAAAAGDLVKHGAPADQALQLALARFGNVDRIKRQCWWIHKGDEVMVRTLGIAILGLLTISVVAVALGGWQLGRNLASRTEELSEQLATLTATQQAMLAQQRPPTVTGRCYLGDPSIPAKNVEVRVFRFSEEPRGLGAMGGAGLTGVVARRLRTDSEGRFDSGILQAGEYCLLAPILAPDGSADEKELPFERLQSRPLNLTAGVGESKIDLDLAATGQVHILAPGIPNAIVIGQEDVSVYFNLTLFTEGDQRYFERRPVPPSDEPPKDGWPVPLTLGDWDIAGATFQVESLPRAYRLMKRNYNGEVALSFVAKRVAEGMGGAARMESVARMTGTGSLGGMGGFTRPLSAGTKRIPVSITISPGSNSTLSVSLIGEPLAQRLEAMIREWEKANPSIIDSPDRSQQILSSLAKSIELKVEQSAVDPSAKK